VKDYLLRHHSAQRIIETSDVSDILQRVLSGDRPKLNDCIHLIKSDNIHALGLVGGFLRDKLFGKVATFVNNIILNYTNVCITYCKFCAFYRAPGHNEAYTLPVSEIVKRVLTSRKLFGISQVLIQGGHNPNLNIEYYEDAFKEIRKRCPEVGIHGLSASEIDMISRVERCTTAEVLSRLKDAGLDTLPGAGAEVLDDSKLGIKSSATMMYGTLENEEQQARHLMKIANLQEKTGGFMAFIPWSFEPNMTQMQSEGLIRYPSGGLRLLKMIAISRIMYHDLINHLQSSWLTNGIGMAQLALTYGADDFGGTLIGEEVVTATGARSTELTSNTIVSAIKQIGYSAHERDNFYRLLRKY